MIHPALLAELVAQYRDGKSSDERSSPRRPAPRRDAR